MLAITAAPAFAQDEESDARDTVIVTGSRIADPSLTGSSPITSVGAVDLSLSNTVNAEQFLNTLPQTVPGFDSTSNNPGIGEATINLRGLGSTRTLVLVNGRRYVSSNQNPGVVDINTIPSALIEKVDIMTGGASATYGSDAMAGVVNFILKDDFEGIEFDNSYELSGEDDAGVYSTSLTLGGNFDGGRGNAVLSLGYTNREALFASERDGSKFTYSDTGSGFSQSGSVNIPSTLAYFPGADFTAAGVATPPCSIEGTELDDTGTYCTSDSYGFLFAPNGPGVEPFVNVGDNTDRYNYAPVNYLQIPQERYTIYGSGSYEITPTIEAYAQAIYVSSQTEQILAPTPAATTITVNLDNPFLAGDTAALNLLSQISGGTDTDGNGVDDAQFVAYRRTLEGGGRLSDIRNDSFQIQGGLTGSLWEDYTWNLFGSFGQAESSITQTGNVHVPSYQAAIREGRANIFDANGLSDDVLEEILVTGAIDGLTEQTVISADISGPIDFATSPFATSAPSFALGAEYREEELSTAGTGLGADVVGFNQAPATAGAYDVAEVFVEANLPLVEDQPFVEELVLNGAYRRSDYSTVGGVNSYATGLSWTPVTGLRVRGQYQRAVRAPNIGELFQPQVNGFPGISDPCSGGSNGGYTGDATTMANCVADGVPAAAVGTNIQPNAQIEGLFGGNPDLAEEVADTYTFGVVWEPSFVNNLALTLDYYDIEIEDVIGPVPAQDIFNLCYVSGISSYCDLITRRPDGQVDIFSSVDQNSASLKTSGIDASVDYSYDTAEWGTFGIYSLITWQDENTYQSLPTADPYNCVGYYGSACGEPTPEWKFNTRFDWSMGPYGARLRWTRISEVEDEEYNPEIEANPGNLYVKGVDAYDQLDLTLFYTASDNLYFQLGVQNLTDEDYVLIGDSSAEQANTYPATYDPIGRKFFGRATLTW